ncbi:MAG: PilN domain-containing protein [Gemmatimonadota bacterium]|jgi:Tfp pilus assembly protein PilN
MTRAGLEIGPDALRAVRLGRGSAGTFEVEWDPDLPGPGVARLAAAMGRVGLVTAAIHPSLLRVRRLKLPPLSVRERRRALEMEPDRHFAFLDEALVFSLPGDTGLVFAASRARVEAWLEALAELGPVLRLEPSAVASGRTLRAAGAPRDAEVWRLDVDGGAEWCVYRDGRLQEARRVFGQGPAVLEAVSDGREPLPTFVDPWPPPAGLAGDAADLRPLPEYRGVSPRFLAAYGAALEPERDWEQGFLTEPFRRRLVRRRAMRTTGGVLAMVAAIVFLVLSWSAYRQRVEASLDAKLVELRDQAAPVLELRAEAVALARSLGELDRLQATRPDVLGTLRALSTSLPADAWIRRLSASGQDWQIEGSADNAAALIPLLERHPLIEDVRFVGATTRIERNDDAYDTFILAFRSRRSAPDAP